MKRKIISIFMLGILVLSSVNVEATNSTSSVIDPYARIPYVDGETSLGVQVVDSTPSDTLSFEVPLYVTMAVADLDGDVIVPDEYGITNFSQDPNNTGVDIAVVWVEATSRSTNSYWNFVETLTEVDDVDEGEEQNIDNEMVLNIGGIPVVIDGDEPTLLDLHNSVFYNNEESKYVPIAYEDRVQLDIVGKVKPSLRTADDSKTAVAQFSIKYTVSQLDESGEPVGVYYEGAYPPGYTP